MTSTALEFAYWVNQTAEAWWLSLGHASLQAGAVAANGQLLVMLFRRRSSPHRYGILVALLMKFMLAPFLLVPNSASDLFTVDIPVQTRFKSYESTFPQGISEPSALLVPDTVVVKSPVLPAPASSLEDPAVWSLIGFKGWCFLGHLLGTLGVVCWLVTQCVWLGLWVVRESSDASPYIWIMSQEVRADLNYSKQPDVRVSAKAQSPMAFQLHRPVIVLPIRMVETLTPDELRPVMAHEMAHLKRQDPLVNTLQILLFGIWWFHPVYWWLSRALRTVREECCDDAVLTHAAEPKDRYCQVLLDAARSCQVATAGRVVLGFGESRSTMKDRIVRIMDPRVHKRARLGVLAAGVLILAILASIPLWQRSSSLERPRAVTETHVSFSPTVRSLLIGLGAGLSLQESEFTDLKACIDQSRLTRSTHNGISNFTLEATREALQDICARTAHPFYAEFLLAKWHEVNQDPNQAAKCMAQALAHAPVVLVRRYELMDGRPLANTPVGTLGVEYRLDTPNQSNTSLVLKYVHLTTDDKGQVYLPGLDTKIRCNSEEYPKGYEIETGRHGYLALHAKYNRLPTIYAWPKGVRRPATTLPPSKFYDYRHAKAVQGLSHRVGMSEFQIDRCYRMGTNNRVTVTDGRKPLDENVQQALPLSDTDTQVIDQAIVHFKRSTLKSHEILQVRVFDHRSRGLLTEYHAPADYEYDGDSCIVLRSLGQPLPERVDVWFWVTEFPPDQSAKVLAAKAGGTVTFPEYSVNLISLKSGSHVNASGADTSHDAMHEREIEVVLKTTAQGRRISKFGSAGGSGSEQHARLALVTKDGERHFSNYVFGRANIQNTYSFPVSMSELSHFEFLPMGQERCFFFDGVRLPDRSGEPPDQTNVLELNVTTHGKAGVFVTDTAAPVYAEVTVLHGRCSGDSYRFAQGLEDPRAVGQYTLNGDTSTGEFGHTATDSTIACLVRGLSVSMLELDILDLSGKPFKTRSSCRGGHVSYQSQRVPVSQIQGVRVRLSWEGPE
jgi:Zn-dependent protease with chaperone function